MSQMIPFRVQDKIDAARPLFPEFKQDLRGEAFIVGVGLLQGGMTSGKPSVAMLIQLPGGTIRHVECSAAMFLSLAAGMKGAMERWGEPWEGA